MDQAWLHLLRQTHELWKVFKTRVLDVDPLSPVGCEVIGLISAVRGFNVVADQNVKNFKDLSNSSLTLLMILGRFRVFDHNASSIHKEQLHLITPIIINPTYSFFPTLDAKIFMTKHECKRMFIFCSHQTRNRQNRYILISSEQQSEESERRSWRRTDMQMHRHEDLKMLSQCFCDLLMP